jgi:rhamnopyranosyl-N-acetylglucosaminyl-diphospho-decaprenol beta-1,3/1,4-galactofuranosyltransferase
MVISAVVVTFNRVGLLKKLISRLDSFNLISRIIIVNNSSSDNTDDFCKSLIGNKYVYINLDINLGGAGGFCKGIDVALGLGTDYVFLMDDDGLPEPRCLESMLSKSEALDILNPVVLNIDNPDLLSFGLGETIKKVADLFENCVDGILYGVINPFNGTLIKTSVFEKIGNVKGEMFIWGDEVEFILRASKSGFRIGTVCNAFLLHPPSKSNFKLFLGRYKIEEKPRHLIGNLFRNNAFIYKNYKSKISVYKYFIIHVIFFFSNMSFGSLFVFIRYFIDGYTNKFKLSPFLKK